jgi:hypothetical protein
MGATVLNFDVLVSSEVDHVRVTVAGTPSIDQLLSLVHVLGVDSVGWRHQLLLVDLREVRTLFTPEQQYRLGQEAACSLAHLRRIASVVPVERITRISEKAARRDGTDVRVFDNQDEALSWLRSA